MSQDSAARKPAANQVAINAFLVLLSLTASLGFLELGIRVYSGVIFPRMMVTDKKLGWRHAKDVTRTFVNEFGKKVVVSQNAHGHRGTLRSYDNGRRSFRILALGDSFTEGVQVGEDEVFTAQLEQADPHLEVLNAGVGGYGTVQEYLYLASEGVKFNPNLVLLMFFENDLTDNGTSYYPGFGPRPYARLVGNDVQIVETLDPTEYEKFILPAPFRMSLNDHSYFYYFLNSRIYQRLFAQEMLRRQQADLLKLDVKTRYELFYGVLDRIQFFLTQRNIPLLVVLIPSKENVAGESPDGGSVIEEYCRQKSINCASLLDAFRRAASPGVRLYFNVDMHWTKQGHKLAAAEILKNVRSMRETRPALAAASIAAGIGK